MPSDFGFVMSCSTVQPVPCGMQVRANTRRDVLALLQEHGAAAHGYTPAWYSAARLAKMDTAIEEVGD
ncbi:hypothetical protein DSM104329_04021 [Capillimicrobium parvum]|uniref:Uncharacterized protein n=2 Tax=Capillimicrobium parvum TaxID=2884022 RepID=A0A9E7C2C5_9ACTN|nr:hypothetical protein DSM104329_04021 [Capillimicrobium parvum]